MSVQRPHDRSPSEAAGAPGMTSPNAAAANAHVRPFVHDAGHTRALHFSICAVQSRLDRRHPDRLDLEYTRLMMAFLLLQPQPAHIGMVGLGGGSLARFCRRHLPAAHIQVAENNPHVIALREQFLVPPDGPQFGVLQADGAAFVREAAGTLDVLLVDGFDADGLPRSLSSQRFFDDCAGALRPGGVLAMNIHTDAERQAKVLERLRRSFGGVALAVKDSDGTNHVVFACQGDGLSALRPGARPPKLDADAAGTLQGAFTRVLSSWKGEFS